MHANSVEGAPLFTVRGALCLGLETKVKPPFRGHLGTQNLTDHKEG